MAAPFTGTWLQSVVSQGQYTGAAKWGTGVNPVHSIGGEGPYIAGRANLNFPPVETPGGQDTDTIDEDYSWDSTVNPDPFLEPYNQNDPEVWGDGSATGTADRPVWGMSGAWAQTPNNAGGLPNPQSDGYTVIENRGETQNDTGDKYPSWGGTRKTKPAGTLIRSLLRGGLIPLAKQLPNEDVAQGWTNKTHGGVAYSRPADDSQVFIQTSDVQRFKTRAGAQNEGSQSEYAAPIESRVIGQKVKNFSTPDSSRHWDMLPYEQVDYMRPFLSRQAGTGYREWQYPNEMYVSPVYQREPSADPEMGPPVGISGTGGENLTEAYDYSTGYY